MTQTTLTVLKRSLYSGGNGGARNFDVDPAIYIHVGRLVLSYLADKSFEFFSSYGNRDPKPAMKHTPDGAIHLVIPASGLTTGDIKMRVDARNRFFYLSEDSERSYCHTLHLPPDGNFEKAVLKAELVLGLVKVTITDFKRRDVLVGFDD